AIAQKMGYCLAQDPYYHHEKADVDVVLVLFPAGEGGRYTPSPELITAVLTLRLGAVVALIDNTLHQAEQKVLENAI
ncbi:TerB N-terminal domain-containing protein, partial [Salmonella enterica subsp. enterica serovar Infantis]